MLMKDSDLGIKYDAFNVDTLWKMQTAKKEKIPKEAAQLLLERQTDKEEFENEANEENYLDEEIKYDSERDDDEEISAEEDTNDEKDTNDKEDTNDERNIVNY